MDNLVQLLSHGEHPVAVGGPHPSLADFKTRIEAIGYVFIKFNGTYGGTDLGVRVDKAATSIHGANFDSGSGAVHVEGSLMLNYTPVRCIADIDLATLSGTGKVVVL